MEKIILWDLESQGIYKKLSSNQHAFRKDHSCDSALSSMVDDLEKAVLNNQYALGIFVDISGTFDNLSIRSSIRAMWHKKLPQKMVNWYSHYLGNRVAFTEYKGYEMKRILTKGMPQGGILSPLIWNITFDELLNSYWAPIKPKGFTDDAALVVTGPVPLELVNAGQRAIQTALEFGGRNGLEFSAEKTEVVIFTRKRLINWDKIPRIIMHDKRLEYSKGANYLGVFLDSKLSFSAHIGQKISASKKLLFGLRQALGVM